MPLRAAKTVPMRRRCPRAASITAPALALMTAVTPPDCAYRRLPVLLMIVRFFREVRFDLIGPAALACRGLSTILRVPRVRRQDLEHTCESYCSDRRVPAR